MHPDLLLFFYLFFSSSRRCLCFSACTRRVLLSRFQGFSLKKFIWSPFIFPCFFFIRMHFQHMFSFLSYIATPSYIMASPLFALLLPHPTSNLFPSLAFLPPLIHAGSPSARQRKWKVYVFCSSSTVWQQEGKLLFYGFIYGSVDFWRSAHHTQGQKWRAAWSELLLVPPVELQTSKGGRGVKRLTFHIF